MVSIAARRSVTDLLSQNCRLSRSPRVSAVTNSTLGRPRPRTGGTMPALAYWCIRRSAVRLLQPSCSAASRALRARFKMSM